MSKIKDQLYAKLSQPKLTPCTFLGVECFIKSWSEKENIEWAQYAQSVPADTKDYLIRCRAIAWSLCDEAGELIFGRDKVDDVASIASDEVNDIFDKILEVQGSTSKKNSQETPT